MPSSKYYQSIVDLPLRHFKQVAVKNNIYALVIEGKPTDEELITAWQTIHTQYADAMGQEDHKLFTNLYKENAILSATYNQILVLIKLLTMCCQVNVFPEMHYNELNKLLQTTFVFAADDMPGNLEKLKRCGNRSRGVKMRLDLLQMRLDSAGHKKSEGGKADEEYFTRILIRLSDHAGFRIDDSITVFEYVERIKALNKFIDHQKQQAHARK